jgi:hypothetical protein
MAGTVSIDKTEFDFTSMGVTLIANGVTLGIADGVETVEYNCSIEYTTVYGRQRIPLMRSGGRAEFDGSITMYLYWWRYVVKMCRESGIPLIAARFQIPVTFLTKDNQADTDTLFDVALGGMNFSLSEGTDLAMKEVPLNIMNVYYSGVDILGNTLGEGAPVAGGGTGVPAIGATRTGFGSGGGGFSIGGGGIDLGF